MQRRLKVALAAVAAGLAVQIHPPLRGQTPPALANCATTNCVYLPQITRSIETTITFGTSGDAFFRPDPPVENVPPGARRLYYNVRVVAAQGQSYRLVLLLPRDAVPDITDKISQPQQDLPGVFCYSDNDPECDAPTEPLVPGTYTLRLLIDDVVVAEDSIVVPPAP